MVGYFLFRELHHKENSELYRTCWDKKMFPTSPVFASLQTRVKETPRCLRVHLSEWHNTPQIVPLVSVTVTPPSVCVCVRVCVCVGRVLPLEKYLMLRTNGSSASLFPFFFSATLLLLRLDTDWSLADDWSESDGSDRFSCVAIFYIAPSFKTLRPAPSSAIQTKLKSFARPFALRLRTTFLPLGGFSGVVVRLASTAGESNNKDYKRKGCDSCRSLCE